jgi:hypothetical protein
MRSTISMAIPPEFRSLLPWWDYAKQADGWVQGHGKRFTGQGAGTEMAGGTVLLRNGPALSIPRLRMGRKKAQSQQANRKLRLTPGGNRTKTNVA